MKKELETQRCTLFEPASSSAPELPRACTHPENLISDENVDLWVKDLARFAKVFPSLAYVKEFVSNGELNPEKIRQRYHEELRFLSRTDAIRGLHTFADEITASFDPKTSLFYFPPASASSRLFHQNLIFLNPQIAKYGYVTDSRCGLVPGENNEFNQININDALAYIYVDDWILSAEQVSSFLTKDVVRRFHTFHLVVSTAGQLFLQAASEYLFPRYIYTVYSDGGMFPTVPVYGFHKIPDTLPDYYATSRYPDYSIFGKNSTGEYISKNTRLVDYSRAFL